MGSNDGLCDQATEDSGSLESRDMGSVAKNGRPPVAAWSWLDCERQKQSGSIRARGISLLQEEYW